MTNVLLVDDEAPFRASLTFTLQKEGYEVVVAADGFTALELAQTRALDIILLDLMLPGIDGVEVCQRLRNTSEIPIILLTARDQEADKIQGLEIGADDYITKPFSTRELLARMKAVMRRRSVMQRLVNEERDLLARMEDLMQHYPRSRGAFTTVPSPSLPINSAQAAPLAVALYGILNVPPVQMDLDRQEVALKGQLLDVSPKEFQLLRALLSHQGRVLTSEQLIESVWGAEALSQPHILEAHIAQLREKIEADPWDPKHLLTVQGVGFQFV